MCSMKHGRWTKGGGWINKQLRKVSVTFIVAYQQGELKTKLLKPNLCTLLPKKLDLQSQCQCEGTPLSLVTQEALFQHCAKGVDATQGLYFRLTWILAGQDRVLSDTRPAFSKELPSA